MPSPRENNPKDFEFITKAPSIGFKDVHPTVSKGGKHKGKDLPAWGGNDGLESQWVCCKQCGYRVNKRWANPGSGWGNETIELV